jgi:hypothetical protein
MSECFISESARPPVGRELAREAWGVALALESVLPRNKEEVPTDEAPTEETKGDRS